MNRLEERKNYYNAIKKTPLRIEFTLKTPILFPKNPIHFDGILAYAVAKELFGHDTDRWHDTKKQVDIPLPLARTNGKHPVWQASVAFLSPENKEYEDDFLNAKNYQEYAPYRVSNIVWPEGVVDVQAAKSLVKEVEIEKPTGPYNESSRGGFKSFFEKRLLKIAHRVIFFAKGNQEEIQRLLSHIHFVGKKGAIGYGQIGDVTVQETEEDYSLFTPDHHPSRILPVEDFEPIKAQMVAFPASPPYWRNEKVLCYHPSSVAPVWEWDKQEEQHKELDFEELWFDEEMDEEDL